MGNINLKILRIIETLSINYRLCENIIIFIYIYFKLERKIMIYIIITTKFTTEQSNIV